MIIERISSVWNSASDVVLLPITELDVLCNCPPVVPYPEKLCCNTLIITKVEEKTVWHDRDSQYVGCSRGGVLVRENPPVESQKRQSCPLPESPNKKRHLVEDSSFKSHRGHSSKNNLEGAFFEVVNWGHVSWQRASLSGLRSALQLHHAEAVVGYECFLRKPWVTVPFYHPTDAH